MNNNIKELDHLALFGTFLGCLNYTENLKQSSNDDIILELKKQNEKYLNRIIEQNELIIKLLKEGEK